MPTPEHKCSLVLHEPQGINPRDLLLRMIVTPPSEPIPQVVTSCSVDFELETSTEYETVSIVNVAHGIPVEIVS
jgi:hypothetical protein